MVLHVEKLIFGGQGLARSGGKARRSRTTSAKVFFVWGALPEEEVEVEIIKNKKDYAEGVVNKIIKASPYRIDPQEDHYLSCSPWQILDWQQENYWKTQIAKESYMKIGKLTEDQIGNLSIENDNIQYGYRNKIEYSFVERATWPRVPEARPLVSLAFFQRGHHQKIPISECKLASTQINQTAQQILSWTNQNKIPERSLKSLIIRSNDQGQTIAGLFVKDHFKSKYPLPALEKYPTLDKKFVGFHLYYSTHKSPASVPTQTLYSEGQDYLVTNIKGTLLKFGLHNFFQVNIPVFEKTLDDIARFLDYQKPIIDYYSGVGSISLPLHQHYSHAKLVDIDQQGIGHAQENITHLKTKPQGVAFRVEASCAPAEKITDLITPDKIIIFDPPRAGLHEKIIQKVLETKPQRLIYLSCNPSTQARDIQLLSPAYQPTFLKLYNFFPRTPHIEGLCVLDLK